LRQLRVSDPFTVVADSNRLAEWAPPVKEVSELSDGPEGLGTTRVCQVEFGGRSGTMTERCVEFEPPHRAAYVVEDDSLGFGRMFADYGFTIAIEEGLHGGSIARTETYYTPRNPLFKLINVLIMRKRFESTVDDLLSGLKHASERDVAPARAASARLSTHPASS
jgi:Polyketide cyclase / dehydrase and lipid transport